MGQKDPRVDAYIAKAAPFAQPILVHIRKLVHKGCPEVEETMKWNFPHFVHEGILCAMAAALRKNKKAKAAFEAFPPSHKREYAEWITEAKGEDTRARRLATALEWISAGKSRNWKYEKKR